MADQVAWCTGHVVDYMAVYPNSLFLGPTSRHDDCGNDKDMLGYCRGDFKRCLWPQLTAHWHHVMITHISDDMNPLHSSLWRLTRKVRSPADAHVKHTLCLNFQLCYVTTLGIKTFVYLTFSALNTHRYHCVLYDIHIELVTLRAMLGQPDVL